MPNVGTAGNTNKDNIMGLHLCPIEPNDWSDGPYDSSSECEACDCTGINVDQFDIFEPCEECGGKGYIDYEESYYYDEPSMSDFL